MAESTTANTAADTTSKEVDTKAETAVNKSQSDQVQKWAADRQAVDQARHTFQQKLEDHGHYTDLGFIYAAPAPIANAVGAEIGVVTTDDSTGDVRRTGVGIYLRCDHLGGTPAKKVAKRA